MATQLNPYLNFAGQAAEAMDFYASVFGGRVDRMLFGQMPDMPGYDESMADLVMHSALVGGAVELMGSDTPAAMGQPSPHGLMSLSGDDDATLRGWWDALAQGGEITMPLAKAPWGDSFGELTDRYGVRWIVNIGASDAETS